MNLTYTTLQQKFGLKLCQKVSLFNHNNVNKFFSKKKIKLLKKYVCSAARAFPGFHKVLLFSFNKSFSFPPFLGFFAFHFFLLVSVSRSIVKVKNFYHLVFNLKCLSFWYFWWAFVQCRVYFGAGKLKN